MSSESFFNMWRLVVLAAHVDHNVHEKEVDMIESYIKSLELDENQKQILRKEIKDPAPLDEILPKITEQGHRSQSIYFTRLLFWKDRVMNGEEEAFLDKITKYFQSFVDIDVVNKQLKEIREKIEKEPHINLPDTRLMRIFKSVFFR